LPREEVYRKVASLRDAGTEKSEPGTGEKKGFFGSWTTHQEVSQATDFSVLRECRCASIDRTGRNLETVFGQTRITDAEAGWRGKIYPIRTRQPALPTSSHEDRGPSFEFTF